jgi:thioredoxin reductase (NADPH)
MPRIPLPTKTEADRSEKVIAMATTSDLTDVPGSTRLVRLFGRTNSPEAYEIRDFLRRSVVEFKWDELTCDADCDRLLGKPSLAETRHPVVQLPDGTRLFAPTLRELAERLGWITQPRLKEYELSIYGAGPAGLSAAVYAASEGISTVLIERSAIGGQAGTSSLIENLVGYPDGVSGADLAERARQQVVKFGADILLMREGIKAEFRDNRIHVNMADGNRMVARANICATGVEYARLDVPGEDRFLRKGVYYGAGASEAQMAAGQHVFVVGGGNSAGQAAVHFSRHASRVSMLVRGNGPAASMSKYLSEKLARLSNVQIVTDTAVVALDGDEALRRVTLDDRTSGSRRDVETRWLFVCIGGKPNTEWAKDTMIARDPQGYLITGPDLLTDGKAPERWPLTRLPYFLETSVPGSFAAGDVRHGAVKRLASAVGEGAMCVTFVHRYLRETA